MAGSWSSTIDRGRPSASLQAAEEDVERTLDFIAKNDLDDATRISTRDDCRSSAGRRSYLRGRSKGSGRD
jgi:hypothetical protein